ncbi:MAG: nitroreductase family protein [Bacteroidetes bacterium]|nr:nitroreductase family protein [Bacteroidota bacterium]
MEYPFIPYSRELVDGDESLRRAIQYFNEMKTRRSVREFSDKPVDRAVIETILKTAGTAPSGANKQPWTFCVIGDPELKRKIRIAAEEEEKVNYGGRMSDEWLRDLAPLGTDWQKPFLEIAPWLIVVFRKVYDLEGGEKRKNYYVQESVGIACGFLISAIHHAGLVTLTHTPSPMNFLTDILKRPENEKPFLLLPVGYPAENAVVPDIHRKELKDTTRFY